jgi:guanylate kinase
MLLMFAGPSTVGKDARWMSAAENLGFARIIPYTTRAKRINEVYGHDYRFLSRNDFQDLLREGKLLEWDYILNEYYGIPIEFSDQISSGQAYAFRSGRRWTCEFASIFLGPS